jgi:hypothetical protein
MSRGYIITVQGNYTAQAELLARSIKQTQTGVDNISIVTNQQVDESLFDHVIPLSLDISKDNIWKIHNRVFNYDWSPYDETVMLDADMVFLSDVSHWWKHLAKHDLLVVDRVKTFRNEWVDETNNPYRQAFTYNRLPNCYSAFTYFKKSEKAERFFNMLKDIIVNWDAWSAAFTPNYLQKWPSIDVAMGIAAKALDYTDIFSTLDYPTFSHMKGKCQGYPTLSDRWSNVLGYNTGDNYLRIGPYAQTGILHYCEKEFAIGEISEVFK